MKKIASKKTFFPKWKSRPFFEAIISLVLAILVLVLCLPSIYLKNILDENSRNLASELIVFFIWYSVFIVLMILGNLYILYIKQNPKIKNSKKKLKIKNNI